MLSELQAKAMNSQTFSAEKASFAPMSALKILFTRLDIQATSMVSTRPMKLVHKVDLDVFGISSCIPHAFASIDDAKVSQEYIHSCWNRDLQLATPLDADHPPAEALEDIRQEYTKKLLLWEAAVQAFLERNTATQTRDDTQAIHLLQVQHLCTYISITIDTAAAATDERLWDPYTAQFQAIVSHVSEYLIENAALAPSKPLFSLDTGIVGPLYLVASRCRDPTIRRQAIACLKSTTRQEGVWQSQIVGHVAQRVMEIEEEAAMLAGYADGDIPSWARIKGVEPELDPEGRMGVIHYITNASGGLAGRNTLHEVVEW